VLTLAGCSGASAKPLPNAATAASRDLAAIRQGQCAKVAVNFDATMRAHLTAPQLCSAWAAFVQQFGEFRSAAGATIVALNGMTVVRMPLFMSSRDGEFRETFNSKGKVAGLYFLRPAVPL
jgi:hypothetical protein